MGRVKDWLMDMEEDSHYLNRRDFIQRHGLCNLSIWNRINCISEKGHLDFEIRMKFENLINQLIVEHTKERLTKNILKNLDELAITVSKMLDDQHINRLKPIILERLKDETHNQVESPETILKLYKSILDRKLKNKEKSSKKYAEKLVHDNLNEDFYNSNFLKLKDIFGKDFDNFMEGLVDKLYKSLEIKAISEENFPEIEKILPEFLDPVFSLFEHKDILKKIDLDHLLVGLTTNEFTQKYVLFMLEEINQEFTFEFMVAETLPYFKDLQNINTVIQEIADSIPENKNSLDENVENTNEPKERHFTIKDGDTGYTYERIFSDYLVGCQEITVNDPYIRGPSSN